MKKLFSTFILILLNVFCYAQRGWDEPVSSYHDLADSDEIIETLKIALPLLIIGFSLAYFFLWRSNTKDVSQSGRNIGCFGIILLVIGVIISYPLFQWFRYLFVNGFLIVIALFIIGFVIYHIFSWLNKM